MALIWSLEDLGRLCRSPHAKVRTWAADHLGRFYPNEAGAILMRLLEDPQEHIAAAAASYFEEYPDRRFADSLLGALRSMKKGGSAFCAKALAKLGDDRFIPIVLEKYARKSVKLFEFTGLLEALIERNSAEAIRLLHEALKNLGKMKIEDGDERGLESVVSTYTGSLVGSYLQEEAGYVLRYFLTSPRREEWGYLVLLAFLNQSGAPYDRNDLDRDTRRKKFSKLSTIEKAELAGIRKAGREKCATEVAKLLERQNYIEAIRMLRNEAEAVYAAKVKLTERNDLTEWEKGKRRPLLCLRILCSMEEEASLLQKTEVTVQKRTAITALIVFSRLVETQEFIGNFPEKMSPDERLALFLQNREDMREDRDLLRLLAGSPPAEAVCACLKRIEESPWSLGAPRAVRLLGFLRATEAVPALLSAYLNEEDMGDDAEDALMRMGETALAAVAAVVRGNDRRKIGPAISLLGCFPYAETVQLILTEFEKLYRISKDDLLMTIEDLGAADFIPVLKKLMKEDEPEEPAYCLLCRLHGIEDPVLSRIEETELAQVQKLESTLSRIMEGDKRALIRETISLPLRCLRCNQTYTYQAEEVYIDQDAKEIKDPFIRDPITCKNCGAENDYEVTPEAINTIISCLNIMIELAEEGKADVNEGPVKLAVLTVAGKSMKPKEGLVYYEREIARYPHRAELRVGYGNLLLFCNREEEARIQFEKAMELEPMALEALSRLADMELDAGRTREAYALYQKCLDRYDQGRFYRSNENAKEQLRAHWSHSVPDLQKELGIKQAAPFAPLIKKEKAGRNDPCPCGSGKKYKKCCLGKDEGVEQSLPKTMMTKEEQRLIGRLTEFAGFARFRNDFEKALSIYYPGNRDADRTKTEFMQFMEWFIQDYPLSTGSTVLKEFVQTQAASLPPIEREMLHDWLQRTISIYEVLDCSPSRAEIRLKDLFTGEELVVHDVSASEQLVKWDLIGARIMKVGKHLRISGVSSMFASSERRTLVDYFTEKWKQHQQETGQESWESFMRAGGYLVYQYRELVEPEAPPIAVTPEYHPVVSARAIYEVRNFHGASYRLKQEVDFQMMEEELEKGETELHFVWLKRGNSKEIVPQGKLEDRAVVLHGAVNTGVEEVATLGNMTLTQDTLTLETLSQERLQAGKARIETMLGGYVSFQKESIRDFEAPKQKAGKSVLEETRRTVYSSEEEEFIKRVLTSHLDQWLQAPIPLLDGKSPQEMIRLPGGKERVMQLLKEVENAEERKRRNGEHYVDVNLLREKLGLPKT